MSDRVSQLQKCINMLADTFCNSIGVLQNTATPADVTSSQSLLEVYSGLISRTAQDIDTILQSLPTEELSVEEQTRRLIDTIESNKANAEILRNTVNEGEMMLQKIRNAQKRIADLQLDMLKDIS